ncbi:NADH-quinone oxidoreductase subunit C [Nonomuraea sp. NPDC050310]|uniref:NADH-quinone oxidoreductase subunit C n=1 Tax=Nonomuraea sp. NPDC050310 TaxID=3154935 RepID=UPI0033E823E8
MSFYEVSETFGERTFDVERGDWIRLLTHCRDEGYEYFDWLTGVDDPPEGFFVVSHVYNPTAQVRVLLRTWVPRADPVLPTAIGVYRGADWHERETFEMFGVRFDGHPNLVPLLLPDGFEGYPLRKEFILAARVAKPWPGAKEPGESAPARRKTLPPGVPADWDAPSSTSLPASFEARALSEADAAAEARQPQEPPDG